MANKRNLKVLILGRNYGSIMNTLVVEYRQLGHIANALCFDYHVNKHCDNSQLKMIYGQETKHRPLKFKLQTLRGVFRLIAKTYRADVIHVFSDIQLHNRFEHRILNFVFNRIAKKKLKYITFLGSEVRNPEIEKPMNPYFEKVHNSGFYEYKKDETAANSIAIQKKYKSLGFKGIFNPEVIHFINPEVLELKHHYNHPGKATFSRNKQNGEKLSFMHAGTAPYAKGSFEINDIMDELIQEGYPIDYHFVTKVPLEEFNYILSTSDFYIDQMIWGWYGVAAIQALSLGIPTITYLGEAQLQHCPNTGIINANLDNLKSRIKELCDNRKQYAQLEKKSLEAFKENHNPKQVATHLINCYISDLQITPHNL